MLVYLIYTEGRSLLLLTAYEADMLGVKSQFFSSSQNTVALTISATSERCRCALSWVARTPPPHQPHRLATAPFLPFLPDDARTRAGCRHSHMRPILKFPWDLVFSFKIHQLRPHSMNSLTLVRFSFWFLRWKNNWSLNYLFLRLLFQIRSEFLSEFLTCHTYSALFCIGIENMLTFGWK